MMNRRQFLGSAIASAIGLALGDSAQAATLPIAIEGNDYERSYGELALDLLRRSGWLPYVANNVALVRFAYVGEHGGEMVRNTHASRCTVLLPQRLAPNIGEVASLLVHESAHQCLYNHGLGYEQPQWAEFPYAGRVRPWQLAEFSCSVVEQAFRECAGLANDVYRRPENLA